MGQTNVNAGGDGLGSGMIIGIIVAILVVLVLVFYLGPRIFVTNNISPRSVLDAIEMLI